MGGYGSGRNGWRPHIESAFVFDLSTFKKVYRDLANCRLSGSWVWRHNGECTARVSFVWQTHDDAGFLRFNYHYNGEPVENLIEVVSVPLAIGGKRWWMFCPATGKRACKLYLFPSLKQFLHRTAIYPKPTYAIQRTSGRDKIVQQRWAIRRKLNDRGSLFDPLTRPKGMHRSTFNALQAKDNALADAERGMALSRFGPE